MAVLGKYWIHLTVFFINVSFADQECIVKTYPNSHARLVFNCSMEEIPFTAYYLRGTNCSDHVLDQHYPYLYHRPDGLFPGKPKDFKVIPFEDKHSNGNMYSGGNVTITTPVTASVKDTKGFEVEFHPISGFSVSTIRCLVFEFHRNLTAQDTKKDISLRVFPLVGEEFYFEAYSLPKPPPSEDMYLYWFLSTTNGYHSSSNSSADWVTTISYHNDTENQEISFSFVAAPAKFNFTEYNIELWRNDDTNALRKETISHLYYTFENLSPGTYVVKVQPHDPFWQDNRKCLCKKDQQQCYHCIVTRSAAMEIHSKFTTPQPTTKQTLPVNKPQSTHSIDTVTTSSSTTGAPLVQQPPEQTTPGDGDGISQETVMAAVFGVVAGIALVTVLAFILHQKTRKRKDPRGYNIGHDNNHNYTRNVPESFNNIGLDVSSEFVNNRYRELPKKRIFIVYAEDHVAHVEVIKAFAKFLSDHCRCELIFAPWSTYDVNQDKIRWISRSFDRADFTMIVNSVSAHHQFKAGKKIRSNHDSPLADLYYPTINHIHHKVVMSSDYGRLINVCFEYTKQEFFIEDICAGAQYVLLKHLQEFLCHIHGINQQTTPMRDVGLAFVENISVLPEGEKLLMAIQDAFTYEKSHPNWFEQDFFDSGVESVENLPIEDREAIRRDYESKISKSPDSISKIMEQPDGPIWNIPLNPKHPNIEPSMAYTVTAASNNLNDDQTFVAPSICPDLDVSSNCIEDQIDAVNDKYAEDNRQIYLRQESAPFNRYLEDAGQMYQRQNSSPSDRNNGDMGQIYLRQDSMPNDRFVEDTAGILYLRQDSALSDGFVEDAVGHYYLRQDSTPNDRYDENETVSLGGQSV